VTALNANGPAAKAGIRKGDILVGLQQYETITLDNVTFVLNLPEMAAGNVPFFILRSGQVRQGSSCRSGPWSVVRGQKTGSSIVR